MTIKTFLKLLFIIGLIILIISGYLFYTNLKKGEIIVHFDDKVMDELNELYVKTVSPWEFVGYLYGNQDNITRFGLIGYHNAVNNEISLSYNELDFSEISIHSHPKINHLLGLCYLSNMDRRSMETVVCVMCGIDKIKCYVIN